KTWCGGKAYWTNNWDFPDDDKKDFAICFEEKIKPQVTEILTKYGELCLIWFDVPFTISRDQTDELYHLVKKYQPECLVNSRIGNGYGDYASAGDNEIPNDDKSAMLFETPATLNDTWGYKSFDSNWKSAERIIEIKNHLAERGANYLLNVGPDYLGRIPAPSVDILREVGKKTK
ncbi:MAG: alpha-L-fucosidase, partial [Clostridia bacterium]|nr:alpha-L-fucosidase [Clostridia bacterium]